MSDHDAILFANEAFYRAFTDRDAAALVAVWAEADPVSCIHPGWALIVGRKEVLESWRRILANDASPKVTCRHPSVVLHGDTALVLCYEDIDGQVLAATNIFRRDGRRWRLVHHQSGPTAVQLPPEDAPEPGRPN